MIKYIIYIFLFIFSINNNSTPVENLIYNCDYFVLIEYKIIQAYVYIIMYI